MSVSEQWSLFDTLGTKVYIPFLQLSLHAEMGVPSLRFLKLPEGCLSSGEPKGPGVTHCFLVIFRLTVPRIQIPQAAALLSR